MLTDERILHLQEIYVGGPSPRYPLGTEDWINFARAIEAEIHKEYNERITELERQLSESVELLRSLRHYSNCAIDSSFRPHFDDLLTAVNAAVKAKEQQ